MNFCKLCIVLCAAALFAAACSQTATTPNTTNTAANTNKSANAAATPAATPDEKAMAEKLYTTNCMTCHRDSGKGGKVTVDGKALDPNDLTAEKMKKHTDENIFKDIKEGSPDDGMPAFKDKLTDDQIRAIVKHVRTLQGV